MQIFIAKVVTVLAAVLIFYFIASPLQNCLRSEEGDFNAYECIAIITKEGGSVIW